MLDDDGGRLAEFGGEAACGFEVDEVVVGKLFALELFGGSEARWRGRRRNVKRGGLVRIFAVAQDSFFRRNAMCKRSGSSGLSLRADVACGS